MLLSDLQPNDPALLHRAIIPRLKAYQVAYQGCDFAARLYASLSQLVGKTGADVIFLHSLEQLSRRFTWLHPVSLHPPSLDHFGALYNSLSVQSGDQASKALNAIRIDLAQSIQSLLGRKLAQHLVDQVAADSPTSIESEPRYSGRLPI